MLHPNPIELIKAGCSLYCYKPLLAKVQNGKMKRLIKFDYGGKKDESFVVEQVISGKDSIHFLGFRNIDIPFIGKLEPTKLIRPGADGYGLKIHNYDRGDCYGDRDITQSIILYYSDYNLKKEKNTRKHKVYENTPGYDKKADTYSDYGVLSADSQDDDVYAVFSWVEWRRHHAGATMVEGRGLMHKEGFNLNNVNSDIYYWQYGGKSYNKAEKIAEGFCPLVRVDQFGIVHVFWVDRNGNIVQKIKKGDQWSDKQIISNDFSAKSIIYTDGSFVEDNRPEAILYTKFIAAEFDNENNLHIVYPTAEGIVYTKMKLE